MGRLGFDSLTSHSKKTKGTKMFTKIADMMDSIIDSTVDILCFADVETIGVAMALFILPASLVIAIGIVS